MKEGNVVCEMHEEEIVLSVEYFVPGPNGLAIGPYCLSVCCDPCVVQSTVVEHLQILVFCFEGDTVRKEHVNLQSVQRVRRASDDQGIRGSVPVEMFFSFLQRRSAQPSVLWMPVARFLG